MTDFESVSQPHRRKNPLTGEWVLVSAHRVNRPWQGQEETPELESKPSYDPECYLCPTNTRINGEKNPDYTGPFVFTNDFAALTESERTLHNDDPLFTMSTEQGTARVICFSDDHSKTLPLLSVAQISEVIGTLKDQYQELSQQYRWIQAFENKGAAMGCSNPHPHGQIWAQTQLPSLVQCKHKNQMAYAERYGSNLLLDYAQRELALEKRLVCVNGDWLVVVPYWAAWPFETLLLPRFAISQMTQLSDTQQVNLAAILKELTTRYDNLFQCSFPYSMGWHGAPFDEQKYDFWQLHAQFFPPLLRSASVKKFMVGYEMMAEPQRDITPEKAAEILRQQSTQHYLLGSEHDAK